MFKQACAICVLIFVAAATGCSGRLLGNVSGNAAAGIVNRVVAQPDPSVQLLESELRWMEDNLYRMDHQLDRSLEQLESARRNNAVLRLELAEARRQSAQSSDYAPSGRKSGRPTLAKPKSTSGQNSDGPFDEEKDIEDDELLNLTPPSVELGSPSGGASADDTSPDDAENAARSPLEIPEPEPDPAINSGDGIRLEGLPEPESLRTPNINPGGPSATPPTDPFRDSAADDELNKVTRIKLNPRLTGGYNFDGKRGHDGIMVVIEPQNAFTQYVPISGDVEVELRDPSKPGLAARVGKWKFDAIDAQQKMKKTLMGKGMHLQLPWPAAPPDSERLELTVKYQTRDGRTLAAEKKLLIEPITSALAAKATRAEQTWSPYRPRPQQRTANAPMDTARRISDWESDR